MSHLNHRRHGAFCRPGDSSVAHACFPGIPASCSPEGFVDSRKSGGTTAPPPRAHSKSPSGPMPCLRAQASSNARRSPRGRRAGAKRLNDGESCGTMWHAVAAFLLHVGGSARAQPAMPLQSFYVQSQLELGEHRQPSRHHAGDRSPGRGRRQRHARSRWRQRRQELSQVLHDALRSGGRPSGSPPRGRHGPLRSPERIRRQRLHTQARSRRRRVPPLAPEVQRTIAQLDQWIAHAAERGDGLVAFYGSTSTSRPVDEPPATTLARAATAWPFRSSAAASAGS